MAVGWDLQSFPARDFPFPPFNGEIASPLMQGVLDVRWDNPATLSANTPWQIVGVNIWRSDVGERGPYHRINDFPLGGTFFRDQTDNVLITGEIIDWDYSWVYRGDAPNRRTWRFKTQFQIVKPFHRPLEQPTGVAPVTDAGTGCPVYVPQYVSSATTGPSPCVPANAPADVSVTIDGVPVHVDSVFGPSGEVTLIDRDRFDPVTESMVPAILPGPDSEVLVTYYANRNLVSGLSLERKIYYRLTAVAVAQDPDIPGGLVETPLRYSQPLTPYKIESLDYIFREAVRRNNWLLEQGGERAKVFIRKTAGVPCDCVFDTRRQAYMKQPKNRCFQCFGTGFMGGYEGPYEVILAPEESDRKITQSVRGRHREHTYETWMGPTPLVTQRDFVVKQTNERYSIGPVRRPTPRGMIVQQHFTVGFLDEGDIRYMVPVDHLADLTWPGSRLSIDEAEGRLVYPLAEYGPMHQLDPSEHSPQQYPVGSEPEQATPMSTQKRNIGDSREHRGKTQTWENQNY